MDYQSTRGNLKASSLEAVLNGIAPDGGLYIDPALATRDFDVKKCLALDELGMAKMLLGLLLPDFENMDTLVERAYTGKFDGGRISPLVKCGDTWVLELFHGPTSAFKDVALSMLPQLITAARRQLGIAEETVILTATSGDTGKAALEGFHDVDGTGIIVFYPEGGVSPIQRAQMETQLGRNVRVCAVRGNFDDCQRGVKEAFSAVNAASYGKMLSSANSINIGRLAPQLIYYFSAYAQLLSDGAIKYGEQVDFIVPTGNFGDILAGYYCKLIGLPIGRLVCAANENDVLHDFILTGCYDARREFKRTSSPSMDILVSSNLERLLYLASNGNADDIGTWMTALKADGVYSVDEATHTRIREVFSSGFADEDATRRTIARVWRDEGYLCDPHTAVAVSVMEDYRRSADYSGAPCVVLSTASPFKFPAAVLSAIAPNSARDEDGFKLLHELEGFTSLPIPKNLAALEQMSRLHDDVIDKDGIIEYVTNILSNGGFEKL